MSRVRLAAILRPRILAALTTVPLTTGEVAARMRDTLTAEGAPRDMRGPLLRLPAARTCRDCGQVHSCAHWWPVGAGLIKPHLDALAQRGAIVKVSRGNSRSALWLLADFTVPDTVAELLGASDG